MSLKNLTINDIGDQEASFVTTQQYGNSQTIDGVKLVDLRLMSDDGGSFAEIVRFGEKGSLEMFPEFIPRQSSYSQVLPGAIKAFHLHYNQEDVWFIPPSDRLLMGLVDVRKASPTYGHKMRFVLGAGRARLLYIPRGVAHGCGNLWNAPSTIIYFVNQQFNLSDPDERRLPYDFVGKDFWEITPG
jgi:dTDP-4-dehydrorhamnose 3,5-epimerase